jgi:hypothetical protein
MEQPVIEADMARANGSIHCIPFKEPACR